ncbi:hypothetical protein ACVY4Q_004690, partial [Escherichia coli]
GNTGLIFLIPKVVCHFCIESGFNAALFQQPLKLTEIFRIFEFLVSTLARACNCLSSIIQPSFDAGLDISKSGD